MIILRAQKLAELRVMGGYRVGPLLSQFDELIRTSLGGDSCGPCSPDLIYSLYDRNGVLGFEIETVSP